MPPTVMPMLVPADWPLVCIDRACLLVRQERRNGSAA